MKNVLGRTKQKFDFFIPSGCFCVTTYHLRAAKLQSRSYPFDWLSRVQLSHVYDFLKNDFKNFLELEELTPFEHEKTSPNHHTDILTQKEFCLFTILIILIQKSILKK